MKLEEICYRTGIAPAIMVYNVGQVRNMSKA